MKIANLFLEGGSLRVFFPVFKRGMEGNFSIETALFDDTDYGRAFASEIDWICTRNIVLKESKTLQLVRLYGLLPNEALRKILATIPRTIGREQLEKSLIFEVLLGRWCPKVIGWREQRRLLGALKKRKLVHHSQWSGISGHTRSCINFWSRIVLSTIGQTTSIIDRFVTIPAESTWVWDCIEQLFSRHYRLFSNHR